MTDPRTVRRPIDLVTASAGTGKTWSLVREVQEAIDGGVDPASVLATTFTNKAASELIERARSHLIGEGKTEQAAGLLAARIGTVNATFGRMVGEFALDAGRSPVADVIPEQYQQRMFSIAAETAIEERAGAMVPLAQRLEIEKWENDVRSLVDLVRQNGICAADLPEHAERSWRGMRAIFPAPSAEPGAVAEPGATTGPEAATGPSAEVGPGAAAGKSLRDALGQARDGLDAAEDEAEIAAKLKQEVGSAIAAIDSDRGLPWGRRAKLAKMKPAQKRKAFLSPVVELAGGHAADPRLHKDIEDYIRGVYATAARALEMYERYKAENGLIDFVDQEHEALKLLDDKRVAGHLGETLARVFVDEFQDTSPIQLALFLGISQIAERSFWVGDPKQAIYGFRGSDPELTIRAAREIVPASEGTSRTLAKSFRSRPEIVDFANRSFGPAFEALGFAPEDVRIGECDRESHEDQSAALAVWTLSGSRIDEAVAGLAGQIRAVLENPDGYKVEDRETGAILPLRGRDIAVLCRSNDRCAAVARELARSGLRVSIARPGLLETPEAALAVAALRYLADPRDSLAVAEIAHFFDDAHRAGRHDSDHNDNDGNSHNDSGDNHHAGGSADGHARNGNGDHDDGEEGDGGRDDAAGQPSWFERSLSEGGIEALREELPPLVAIDGRRGELARLTPREALEVAISASGVLDRVMGLDDAPDRIGNLDALRGLAAQYEGEAGTQRSAATAAGLVAWLAELACSDSARPASPHPDAVHVLTYHRAKGLEWPMVVLFDLDNPKDGSAFEFHIETEGDFDVWRPLDGRWVRFWPWPYGQQRKDVHIDQSVLGTEESRRAIKRQEAEEARLLYVGATRARDYLVLAPRSSGKDPDKTALQTSWLDRLVGEDGNPVLDFSRAKADGVLLAAGDEIKVRYVPVSAEDEPQETRAADETLHRKPGSPAPRGYPPYRLALSAMDAGNAAGSAAGDAEVTGSAGNAAANPENAAGVAVAARVELGARIPVSGSPDMNPLGQAVHAFLAFDLLRPTSDGGRDRLTEGQDFLAGRRDRARETLERWGISAVRPEDLLEMGDRLSSRLESAWPGMTARTEVPVFARRDGQRLHGRIDLLLTNGNRAVVIDHKSYPGAWDTWEERAIGHGAQLAGYASAVEEATGCAGVETWVHMPLVGQLIQLRIRS